jgi:hypothetical protein
MVVAGEAFPWGVFEGVTVMSRRRSATCLKVVGFALAAAVIAGSCSDSDRKKRKDPGGPCDPRITQVAPSTGDVLGGDGITIITDCFADDFTQSLPQVFFGVDAAVSVNALNERSLSVITPPHAVPEPVDVTVQATGVAETHTLTDGFTYAIGPGDPCSIFGVAPSVGDTAGGDLVTITGDNFDQPPLPAPTVEFGLGNVVAVVNVLSATTIEAVTQATPEGPVDVTVTTQAGPCVLPGGFRFITGGASCTVSGVNPNQGLRDQTTQVLITGTGFDAPPVTVEFGPGNFGAPVTVLGPDRIVANAPVSPSPGSVDIIVTTQASQCTLPAGFEYLEPPPQPACTITSLNPAFGPDTGGTEIGLFGTGLTTVSRVWLGSTEVTPVVFRSPTEIAFVAPAGTGTVDVTVDIGGGTTCTLSPGFAYVTCGATTCNIQRLSPRSGSVGEVVTIIGDSFETDAQVFFGNSPDIVQAVVAVERIPTEIDVIVPPQPGLDPDVDVQVINPSGACCLRAGGFSYAGCIIESVTPSQGTPLGGSNVLIKGTDIATGGIPDVWFGTEPSPQVSLFQQDVVAMVPPAAGQTSVVVTLITPSGDTCAHCCYFYNPGCNIDAVTPDSGGTHGGYVVTLTGFGFDTLSVPPPGWTPDVRFGDYLSDPDRITVDPTGTIITCTAPPSPIGGTVDVTVFNANPVTECDTTFTYILPGGSTCTVASITPDMGSADGGEWVTITGDGFDAGTGVIFGIRPAPQVTFLSSQQLQALTPPPTGQIVVDGMAVVDVIVAPQGSDPCILPDGYTYLTPACGDVFCSVTGVSPASGPLSGGNTVTISGTSFCIDRGPIEIYFGSTPSPQVDYVDEFTVTAEVPAGAAAGVVPVSYFDGTGCGNGCMDCYTYN